MSDHRNFQSVRMMKQRDSSDRESELHWSDRFRWFNAYVFIGCGAIMIYRAYVAHASWLGLATGLAFVAFGIYRIHLFRRVLSGQWPSHDRKEKRTIRSRV